MIELHFCFTYDDDEEKWVVELQNHNGANSDVMGMGKTLEEAIIDWKEGLAMSVCEPERANYKEQTK